MFNIKSPNSEGVVYPTVSGIFIVFAPEDIANSITSYKKSKSLLAASSQENSTSSTKPLA